MFSGRCSKPLVVEKPTIVRDTVWIHHDSVVITKPQWVKTLPGSIETKYLPDTNYQKLLVQYQNLLSLYFAKNIMKDSLKIDSIGYVHVKDTVTKNLISGRTYTYDLKYPVITTTITLPPDRKNQFYIGGSLQGTMTNPVNQINAGLMLKNRKDQLYGIYTGMNMHGELQFGVSSYWKIHLGK